MKSALKLNHFSLERRQKKTWLRNKAICGRMREGKKWKRRKKATEFISRTSSDPFKSAVH
jgi:hypothetical protein